MISDPDTVDRGRRSFLGKIALGFISIGLMAQGWTYLRSLIPNILYEPPKKFKVGLPEAMAEGVNFIDTQRVFIIKTGGHFSCLSARCTHLGCTVKHIQLSHEETVRLGGEEVTVDHEFHCPCHGSKFRQNGAPYSGPAPKGLPWHGIKIAPEDGQLVVDVSTSVDSNFKLVI